LVRTIRIKGQLLIDCSILHFSSVHYHLCIIICALSSVHYHLCIIICALSSVHYHLCIINCALSTVHYQLCIIICALSTVHYHLCIIICALSTVHYHLCIINCACITAGLLLAFMPTGVQGIHHLSTISPFKVGGAIHRISSSGSSAVILTSISPSGWGSESMLTFPM